MRLIDADALIEYVNRRYDLCSDELRMMIEEQPTAYDVDKVVAELERRYEVAKRDMTIHLSKDVWANAINIVRKGGVE